MHSDTHLQNIKLGMQSGDSASFASSTFVDLILFKLMQSSKIPTTPTKGFSSI